MTDARYEIIVEVNGENRYLDTYKYEPITLTYNVADIQDISKRNSSFSRTITLPETQNNRDVFNNISDLAADSTFNPNLKAKAWILVDTVSIFEGYIQLKSVTLSDTLENKYEVVVFADNDTFFTRLGERYIEELDYSDLNHIYGTTSIINSWTSGQQLGYFYPLIDYGQGWTIDMISPNLNNGASFSSTTDSYVNISEMFPATYVKTIWDKIFNESEFYYQSNFLNSQKFKDLLIPYNGNLLDNGPTFSDDYEFRVGSATPSLQVMTASISGGVYRVDNFDAQLKFNNLNSPNGDPNGFWNSTTFTYINNTSDVIKQRFGYYLDIDIDFTGGLGILQLNFSKIKFYRKFNPDGTTNATWATGKGSEFGSIDIAQIQPNFTFLWGQNVQATLITANKLNLKFYGYSPILDQSLTQNILQPLLNNEEVRFSLNSVSQNGLNLFTVTVNDGYIFNEVYSDVIPNSTIVYGANIPKKIKQKDFITSIIKMFNLYIEPSKEYDNTLIIEPRDDYYASGQIKDWTDKIDLNVDIQEQILADTQNKQILFTYKDDKDRLNTLYKSTYNEIYGQYLYDSENEFSTGVKKIDVIFSPTPIAMVPGSFNFPIPRIVKDDVNYNQLPGGRIDPNIRIVTRYNDGNNNGLLPFDNEFDSWGFEGVEYNQGYPYVGHYDNPYTPTDDINWGQLLEQYFPSTIVTDDNLVNNYWIKFLDETTDKDSRIITVEMYLTPVDIYNFKFNDIIYLFFNGSGHYYKVNKISNYDPGLIKTCQVELIKAKDIPKLKRTIKKFQKPTSLLTTFSTNVINLREGNEVISGGSITTGTGNVLRGNDLIINGDDNSIRSNNNFVNGDRNTVYQDTGAIIINGASNSVDYNTYRAIINGDENLISASSSNLNINGNNNIVGTASSNIQVFGSNNTVGPGLTNSIVFGDGVIATQSNQTYIGNNVVITGGGSLPPSTTPTLQQVTTQGSTTNISTNFQVTSTSGTAQSVDIVAFQSGNSSAVTLSANTTGSILLSTFNSNTNGGNIILTNLDKGDISLTSTNGDIKLKATLAPGGALQPSYVEINTNEKKWAKTAQKTTTGTGNINSDILCGLGTTSANQTPTLIRGVIVVKNGTDEQLVTFDDAYGDAGNQLIPGAITIVGYGTALLGGLTSFMTGTNDYYLNFTGVSGTTTYDVISITTYSL